MLREKCTYMMCTLCDLNEGCARMMRIISVLILLLLNPYKYPNGLVVHSTSSGKGEGPGWWAVGGIGSTSWGKNGVQMGDSGCMDIRKESCSDSGHTKRVHT